jgi:hypothetical protein
MNAKRVEYHEGAIADVKSAVTQLKVYNTVKTEYCYAIGCSSRSRDAHQETSSSGGYTSVQDVLRRALEAQDAEEDWSDEERRALSAHIEEGYLQAERGELIDAAQACREIQSMKDAWRKERSTKR